MKKKQKNEESPTETPGDGVPGKPEKQPKVIHLKQYMVAEAVDPEKPRESKIAFIFQTCALNARKEFEERFGLSVGCCLQAAESELVKEDLQKYDFWEKKWNWEMTRKPHVLSAEAERYFQMKERAERVQAAKKAVGIQSWEDATDEQLAKVNMILIEKKK